MSSTRLLFICLLATAFATAAISTATAFAEGPVWLVNGKVLEAGHKAKAEGKGSLGFFSTAVKWKIECKKLAESMTVLGGEPGKDEDTLKYSECTVAEPANCSTTEPIVIEANTVLVFLVRKAAGEKWKNATLAEWEKSEEGRYGDEFKSRGKDITEITLSGEKCEEKGTWKITGTFTGIVNNGLEFTHESDNFEFSDGLLKGEGFSSGFMEYFLVNEKHEKTGETFAVTA
jgi:hypothetical protein